MAIREPGERQSVRSAAGGGIHFLQYLYERGDLDQFGIHQRDGDDGSGAERDKPGRGLRLDTTRLWPFIAHLGTRPGACEPGAAGTRIGFGIGFDHDRSRSIDGPPG